MKQTLKVYLMWYAYLGPHNRRMGGSALVLSDQAMRCLQEYWTTDIQTKHGVTPDIVSIDLEIELPEDGKAVHRLVRNMTDHVGDWSRYFRCTLSRGVTLPETEQRLWEKLQDTPSDSIPHLIRQACEMAVTELFNQPPTLTIEFLSPN